MMTTSIDRRAFLGTLALAALGFHRPAAADHAAPSAIRLGVCGSAERLPQLRQVGYDYLEMSLTGVAGLSEERFHALCATVDASPVKVEACNGMLPHDLRIVGPRIDHSVVADYLTPALTRARRLGARVVVFGSGRSRRALEDFPRERAIGQIVDFLHLAAEIARRHEIVIAIEPLRAAECNMINTVHEGLALARRADRPNVRVLADFFHMAGAGEGPDAIIEAGEWLVHAHIASGEARQWPRPDHPDDYKGFFNALRQIGYRGGVSLEGRTEDYERDLRVAHDLMRALAAQAAFADQPRA